MPPKVFKSLGSLLKFSLQKTKRKGSAEFFIPFLSSQLDQSWTVAFVFTKAVKRLGTSLLAIPFYRNT